MAQRALGTTGLKAFPVGLGTVKLGRNRDVKYPGRFELPDDRAVQELLEAALELGRPLLDTAPAYGSSEARLGPFVRAHRDELVLCSKAGENYDESGSHFDFSAAALEASVDRSLARLGTDHLDLLLLHSDGRDEQIFEETDALEGLRRIREAGKARAIGLSAKTAGGVLYAARELDAVMAPFGPAHRALGAALEQAHRQGCATLAIKVLGQGHAVLGGGADPVQEALDLVLGSGAVDVAVIGTLRPEHLRDAARKALQVPGVAR